MRKGLVGRRGASRRRRAVHSPPRARSSRANFRGLGASPQRCTPRGNRSALVELCERRDGDSRVTTGLRHLCVHYDARRLFAVGRLVQIDRAEPVRVSHHRYPRALLDRAHERIAPPRDDQVDVPVLREQRRDLRARLNDLYERPRERRARQRSLDGARQLRSSTRGLLAAFEDSRIT